jgi:HTH-type transcriptional regulator / antitoxin HigA
MANIKNEYMPDSVSPPGETLLETLEALGMSQTDLANRMGRPLKTTNEIIKGKTAITPETALQLEKVLSVPARFWLNREQQYRESLARQAERENLGTQLDWLDQIPVSELAQRNLIEWCEDRVQLLRNVLTFFGVASPREWHEVWFNPNVAFRKTLAYISEPGAVAAWLREGELQAQGIHCEPFDGDRFRAALQQIRSLTVEPPEVFKLQMRALCAGSGVAVTLVKQFDQSKVSGATRWLTPDKALLQLSLRYKTNDHFWFSFFHESGHILIHGKRDVFLEDGCEDESAKRKEEEADKFARDFLIDVDSYGAFVQKTKPHFSKDKIRSFAAEQGVAPGIVVGRLQHDQHIPYANCNELKQRFEWPSGE